MKNRSILTGMVGLVLLGATQGDAAAAPALRAQVSQRGDFVLIGNTLAHDCAMGTPPPVVGTVPADCGVNTTDTAPDVFWRSDSPMNGQAEASTAFTSAEARSTAVLALPAGAVVTHAYLYWAASNAAPDLSATLERGAFSENLAGMLSGAGSLNLNHYQAVADITSIVQQLGAGPYRLSGVDVVPLVGLSQSVAFAGWWMVVFYRLDSEPARSLTLFDGLDVITDGEPASSVISGFVVPSAGFSARLGVVAYDGDGSNGDALQWNGTSLSDALNPADNFFNGTRSLLGAAVSVAGDLPQLAGTAASMSGVDYDIVEIPNALLSAGQSNVTVSAISTGADSYLLGGLVTSISTLLPDLSTSQKSVTDINGAGVATGDILEYTIVVTNTGDDAAANLVLTDPLPTGVTYMPGTLEIVSGPNQGAKTDAAGDDQAEYDGAGTVTFRLGTGAGAAQGGTLAVGESTTVRFRVTVDADADGLI
ncbi:MAG TPA: hypothetical protein VLS89_12705, partial [Candidatus Nanopelagicales bacterium]|nr:hypothetical protein [Candidatus Nanopelagicales bacterium]